MEKSRKRHRRTKAELLQDPEYCRKHGLKPPKPQKVAKSASKRVEKAASPVKKRHRRTKAELLKDPAYRKKHGLDSHIVELSNSDTIESIEKKVAPKRIKRSSLPPNQASAEIESRYLTRMYGLFEKMQSEMSEMENELCSVFKCNQKTLGQFCREFQSLDIALGQMQNRLQDFDNALDRRRALE